MNFLVERLHRNPDFYEETKQRLVFIGWYKYRVRSAEAADIFQSAITTYLEVHERYGPSENHFGILIGIFNRKCLEYIGREVKTRRRMERFVQRSQFRRDNPWLSPEGQGAPRGALEEVLAREQGRLILEALEEIRPEAREMFRLLVEEELGRKGLLELYGLNKNTLDSRLHVYRAELREILKRKGVAI